MSAKASKTPVLEIVLKGEIKRQSGLKRHEEKCGDFNFKHLQLAWKAMIGKIPDSVIESLVWDYFLNKPEASYIQVDSKDIGEMSRIGQYENEKGKKHLAHFKHNGKYLGAVSKLGDKPISYTTAIPLSNSKFTFRIGKLNSSNPDSEFQFLFELKK